MTDSPTSRSLKKLRSEGYAADVVEKWIAAAKVRKDWGGFGDILAAKPGERILLVQTTSAPNLMARWHKTVELPAAEIWLRAGGAIEIHGWAKRGAQGKRKLWSCDVRNLTLLDIQKGTNESNLTEVPTVRRD